MNSPLSSPAATERRPSRSPGRRFLAFLGRLLVSTSLLLAVDCSREPDTGGETHFLRRCAPTEDTCGETLECRCGVCSRVCEDDDACAAYPNAVCREPRTSAIDACPAAEQGPICDVLCDGDGECAALSEAHVCRSGVCRLEEPATGTGGAAGCEREPVPADAVVLLGDSFLATTGETTARLEDLARAAGSLGSAAVYRDHSRLTENTLALLGAGLLSQYEDARSEGPIRLVLVQAGGADVLLGSCMTTDSSCPLLVDAASALASLLDTFATDSVEHVVLLGYPDPIDGAVRERMDALRPLLTDVCTEARLPCTFLDLRETFQDRYDVFVSPDGLNPTAAGAEATASALWETMRRECLAP